MPETTTYAPQILGGILHCTPVSECFVPLNSGGGTEAIAVVLKDRWNFSIGQFNVIFNGLLFLLGAYRLPLDLIVASMIMMFISSSALEYVLGMFNRRKLVMVISDHGEEISEAILVTERFGATMLRGKGAYSGSDREILLTAPTLIGLERMETRAGRHWPETPWRLMTK